MPFEVLSITVSLISRILFEYGYFYKRLRNAKNPAEKVNNDIPYWELWKDEWKNLDINELKNEWYK